MPKAILDSTILVSAFLKKTGISAELLHQAKRNAYVLYLSDEILEETQRVLLEYQRIRKRYLYSDRNAIQFIQALKAVAHLSVRPPKIPVIMRDSNDDAVIACAVLAKAKYIVTRDKDLLSFEKYKGIKIISPEKFMGVLREKIS